MDLSIFTVALQSSFVIGLIHGINPCGHSWLVLAPFVSGERSAARVAWLTFMFLSGTSLACLALGLSLGAISGWIPTDWQGHVDWVVNGVIIALGVVLVIHPGLLHNHGQEHGPHAHEEDDAHGHGHQGHVASGCGHGRGPLEAHHHPEHNHGHSAHPPAKGLLTSLKRATGPAMFGFGFVNMIIPCPTAAIMFKYAITSADPATSAMVFGSYAVGTALSVGLVIAGLYKAASWIRRLEKPWLEGAIMRGAGALIVMVGVYSLLAGA